MFYTYIIKSKKDSKWYTGYTKDLQKRFNEHNKEKVFSTKGRGPFELIYYEACKNEIDAKMRENFLKSGMGKSYLKNRLKRFLSLTGFTFIELMIAVTIFAVIAGALYSSFGAGISVWNKGEKEIIFNQDMRIAFDDFGKDFKNTVNYKSDDPIFNFLGEKTSVRMLTRLMAEGEPRLFVVSYFTKEEENGSISIKRADADYTKNYIIDPLKAETVLSNLSEADFSYVYGTGDDANPYEWSDTWSELLKIPRGIKLSLKLKSLNNESQNALTKIVFIPMGELVKKP